MIQGSSTAGEATKGNLFQYGSIWVRGDFHLHTQADKEFKFDDEENFFVSAYIDELEAAGVGLGVITCAPCSSLRR